MNPMSIANNKALSVALVVVGGLLLVVSLLAGPEVIGMIAGAVLTLLGTLQLVNPILKVQVDEVQVCNPLGMAIKRFPVSSPADLRIDGKKLVHVPKDKKITTLGLNCDQHDVAELRAQLQQR